MHNASSDSKVLLKSNSTTAYCLHLKQNLMMKKFTLAYVGALFFVVISLSCQEKQFQTQQPTQDKIAKDSATEDLIFERGTPTSKDKFVGNVYMNLLVEEDSVYTTKSGSVTFEAGARTNWHYHPSGQILMVTNGVGYHQIEGQRAGQLPRCRRRRHHRPGRLRGRHLAARGPRRARADHAAGDGRRGRGRQDRGGSPGGEESGGGVPSTSVRAG